MVDTVAAPDWRAWQQSWDRQQEWYMPDREERFRVMLDAVEALVGPEPRILDLACGTGSITDRALRRFPRATSTGVDLDPALLTIARGHFAADDRVRFVTADLRDPEWTAKLPHRSYDAVLTATALHWLDSDALRALYGQLAGVVRDGGVFLNADHMPGEGTPRIDAAVRAFEHARQERARTEGAQDWVAWWQAAAADTALGAPAAERFKIFGNPADGPDHANGVAEAFQPVGWHADTLREVGFGEARAVWCSPSDAMVLGLK
ncbi:class I SAM-dependent methyltransferase [Streptomyces sp. ME19-01-6]|uniref:class I SAM-dependent methyltransferase n=1 Tax=Streptomyces sp. ME19-01-6 TaxID=3028686 RepID=UPI0029BC4CDA|nr:class I SAM-dependent methyltransferase [Streptomyces sp. ME19-01-6]MDX3225631.1 class I SAM-dependent methyltransferase [Streptomyces sp. ME19-01-6]